MENTIYLSVIPLLVGWMLDLLLGDPSWLPHPVVWFGKMISWCEHRLNKGGWRRLKGGMTAVGLVALVFVLIWLADHVLCGWNMMVAIVFRSILIFYCLAGTTLIREVQTVFFAADRSLEEGRKQVGRIVGRDTSELTGQEVRTAALETLAENLSDGVVAPLFWFLIGGVPGMMAYKMVNTLDSMIGYRTERYREFGCVAARIDDVANWLPARLTAILMVIVSGSWKVFAFIRKYGRCHASPNSGYPESALAGILNCRFGGPHYYFGEFFPKPYIGENDRPLTLVDMRRAVRVNHGVEVLMVMLTTVLRLVI